MTKKYEQNQQIFQNRPIISHFKLFRLHFLTIYDFFLE